ncbi:LamG-like jellyroll fold domain-containing protein [Botryobacter ruber]|uniref:LamG-like jellyroll fold domain-containing protein n=1 Tax=Botryobacter ruber TaxID=2171629 RepID=UPI000E0A6F0A|nr:LamG-like jellyroll fold domain-containing protein [Botryobacter ruber]
MRISNLHTKVCSLCLALAATALASCEYSGNPNDLPDVNPADYVGKIDGYNNSEEIFPDNLVAYWSFDDTKKELVSDTEPTSSLNDSYVEGGVRGKALQLNSGWVYYAKQFENFKTAELKSFTISHWVQIRNNGSKRTMTFQLARPGIQNGNINVILNTQLDPAANANILRIQPTFNTQAGGFQDNLNNQLSPDNQPNKWVHIVLTYDITTGIFNIWADGVKVGNFPNRGLTNTFYAHEPSEVIIGANYNSIPGKQVNNDTNFAPMNGKIDEIRVYDIPLPDAHIRSLYNLGLAGK